MLVGNEHKKYLDAASANSFALWHAKGIYENQRKDYKDRRVLNLTRSGYASGQKYGAYYGLAIPAPPGRPYAYR